MIPAHTSMGFQVAGRRIGPGSPCFVVAEAGVNHDGSVEAALQMVDVAAAGGADAVKFQTFRAERMVTETAPKAAYQIRNTGNAESQLSMLRRLELSPDDHRAIQEHCRQRGILFLSTPFEQESADFLNSLGMPVFKIASGELTNLPLLERIAGYRKPMLVSTGMASLGEVESAVRVIAAAGNRELALLHCVSNYPASAKDVNLRAMGTLAAAFGVPVGYSDHTVGVEVPYAAVALGACILEKHFTLDRGLPGPDQTVSLEPSELSEMVRGIRCVEAALGDGRKVPATSEAEVAGVARKSLVAATDIPVGATIATEMVTAKRPGTGLAPSMLPAILGRRAKRTIAAGEVITVEALL